VSWLEKQLKITHMSDWYKVSHKVSNRIFNLKNNNIKDLLTVVPSTFIRTYNLPQLLSTTYPEYVWLPWKFNKCPNKFWGNIHNQRKFLEWATKELNIKEKSDWYKVSARDLQDIGGASLLIEYNGSPSQLLNEVYPEYDWLPWKFVNTPNHIWTSEKTAQKFLEWAGTKLGVKEYKDWLNIPTKDIAELGYHGNIRDLLVLAYPQHSWEFNQKPNTSFYKKSQHLLKSHLKALFPKEGM
jgi:hypothetical protein